MNKQTDITMALVDGPDLAFMATVGASIVDLVDFLADGRTQPEPPAPAPSHSLAPMLDSRRAA